MLRCKTAPHLFQMIGYLENKGSFQKKIAQSRYRPDSKARRKSIIIQNICYTIFFLRHKEKRMQEQTLQKYRCINKNYVVLKYMNVKARGN